MNTDSKQLEEVVVITAFGINRQQKSLGYAAQGVNSDELNKNRQPNILNALQGKVAGATISSVGGGPGQGRRLQEHESGREYGTSRRHVRSATLPGPFSEGRATSATHDASRSGRTPACHWSRSRRGASRDAGLARAHAGGLLRAGAVEATWGEGRGGGVQLPLRVQPHGEHRHPAKLVFRGRDSV